MDYLAALPVLLIALLALVCVLMAILLWGHERRFRKLERDQDALKLEIAKLILQRQAGSPSVGEEPAQLMMSVGSADRS